LPKNLYIKKQKLANCPTFNQKEELQLLDNGGYYWGEEKRNPIFGNFTPVVMGDN